MPDDLSYLQEDEQELIYEVLKMPNKYKIIIYLYYYEGYSIKEIAKILKMNENTVGILSKWPAQSENQKIFELMLEENAGNTSEFVQNAISLRNELKDSLFSVMLISQIARKHIIYNCSYREVNMIELDEQRKILYDI